METPGTWPRSTSRCITDDKPLKPRGCESEFFRSRDGLTLQAKMFVHDRSGVAVCALVACNAALPQSAIIHAMQ